MRLIRVSRRHRAGFTLIEMMAVVASAKELPLGAKDLFLRELRAIYTLKNSLSSPPFDGDLPAETAHDVELAEKILREIIERAPALLDLSMGADGGDAADAAAEEGAAGN